MTQGNKLAKPAGTGARSREDERQLLAAARAGDRKALKRLVEVLSGPAYRFGRTFCRNPEDAEDVMQDVLASAVRSVGTIAGRSSLSTWAYSVARNACSHMRRRRVGEPARFDELTDEGGRLRELPHPTADPARDLERSEVRERLRIALSTLPPGHREAILLRDVEGLTAARAARLLGITERALKSRLHRGRAALKTAIARLYPGTSICEALGATEELCRDFGRRNPPKSFQRAVGDALRAALRPGTATRRSTPAGRKPRRSQASQ